MRIPVIVIVCAIFLPATLPAQDSTRRRDLDSATLDTAFRGPHYRFTGQEDPALLAAIYRRTFTLGKQDAGDLAKPAVLCLRVGRDSTVDVDRSVLVLLADHQPPVRPYSACTITMPNEYAVTDKGTGRRAWILGITAVASRGDSTIVYSDFYVGPLFAAGWVCNATHETSGWVVGKCTMRWIS